MQWQMSFDTGTLVVRVPSDEKEYAADLLAPKFVWDARIGAFRAAAIHYRWLLHQLTKLKQPYVDEARAYESVDYEFKYHRVPFYYQTEALQAWTQNGSSGVVVLPTGAGKSFVAQLAMAQTKRSALVVTPTLDLVAQWHRNLESTFGIKCGMICSGAFELAPITVTTYDSAYIHMERIGNRFGLIVYDEVHHLPTQTYALGALHAIAPYRLGLTATPERDDDCMPYEQLLGPIIYRQTIRELAGSTLANYQTIQYEVELTDAEREAYDMYRSCYLTFIREQKIRLGTPSGWGDFLKASSRSRDGREALRSHRMQQKITQRCEAKLRLLNDLLRQHRNDRTIIFTADNETVYQISRDFLVPAITHLSPVKERREILDGFNNGTYPVVVTSRVLNEGVDIPAANVGIVLSGSGSVREHVQRLGRILRGAENKNAILYELVAKDTGEAFTSERRRKHEAF